MPPQRWGGYSLLIAALTAGVSERCRTEHHRRGKQMSDFLNEVQSDELAECVDYQEWIDLRRLEAINQMEIDYNQMSQECWEMLND
jgi:hypothetical protein